MSGVEQRLRSHLGEQAAAIETIDQGVHHVMNEGRRKRNGRLLLIGAASAAACVGLVVASVAVFGGRHNDPDSIVPAGEPVTLGLTAASLSGANFDWSLAPSATQAGQLGNVGWASSMSSHGLSRYTFGTVPVPAGQPRRQQLFLSGDGIDPSASGVPFDPWISDLDSSAPDQVYAIGTVPEGTSFGYQVATTVDGAATWTNTPLPLDLESVRRELGEVITTGAQVVSGDGIVVAMVQISARIDGIGLDAIDEIDAPFGSRIASNGVEVFGEPTDLDAIAARECPPGWPLVMGAPRPFGTDNTGPGVVATTTAIFPGDGGEGWHCESPDGNAPDLWIEPERVHGDVVEVVPFDQLALGDASLKALRQSVRVFTSTDGVEWSEATVDAGGSTATRPMLVWTGQQFALRSPGAAGTELWLSSDGVVWAQATLPPSADMLAMGALPDGSLLLAGRQLGELVAYTSADGATWRGVSLDPLLQLDSSWRVSEMQLVSGPDGASLMVHALDDGVATIGPPVIDHGRFSLRLTDSYGVAELLSDGQVVDRLDSIWAGAAAASLNGLMSVSGSGSVAVVEPATGEQLDQFSSSEIQLEYDTLWSTETGQRFQNRPQPGAWWVLDTVDGSSWGLTALDLSANNIWLGALGEATPAGHAYRFATGNGTAVVLGRPKAS